MNQATIERANRELKAMIGEQAFEIATLRAQVKELQDKVILIGRMLPPEALAKLAPELGVTPPPVPPADAPPTDGLDAVGRAGTA